MLGEEIEVQNQDLAEALLLLKEEQRTIILVLFYLGLSDRKIGDQIALSTKTVNRRRRKAAVQNCADML